MDRLCPEIERLVSCYTCSAQSLPPYRLCWGAHVGCPPCSKYLPRCACGQRFNCNSNVTFDWLVSSMALRCKYRPGPDEPHAGVGAGNDVNDCGHENRWFAVKELREHYRSGCAYNLFACPLDGCGHVARVETAAEHYETAHGPFDSLEPARLRQWYEPAFKIPSTERSQIVRKIFNGYFLFDVQPQKPRDDDEDQPPDTNGPRLSMQNINPADLLRYTYDAVIESKEIVITVSIMEPLMTMTTTTTTTTTTKQT